MKAAEALKREAAARAVDEVRDGMVLGLGTGSTVAHFLELLGERLRDGDLRGVSGIPTSVRTADAAHTHGIPLTGFDAHHELDLTVDGADEVDPALDLIKGLGGALLREKVVAQVSKRLLIVVDESKRVHALGTRAPVPVEVASFGWQLHVPFLESFGARPVLREVGGEEGVPYATDNGNYVLDCFFEEGVPDPRELERALGERTGVVECGLFLGLATRVVVAGEGGIEVLERPA